MAGGVEELGTLGSKPPGTFACREHPGQKVGEPPAEALGGHEAVELPHHAGVIVFRVGVNGEHTRGVTDAQHLLARELPVDIAGQCGEKLDVFHVLLAVEDGLIEMRDAPAQGDVEREDLR